MWSVRWNHNFLSHLSECSSFPSVSTRSDPTFSFVAVVRVAITASGLAGADITCKTMSRSNTATTSPTGAALVVVPRWPVKLIGELTVHTANELVVVYSQVCNHQVPRVTLPLMEATRWRIVPT